jgi:hypothetical protein
MGAGGRGGGDGMGRARRSRGGVREGGRRLVEGLCSEERDSPRLRMGEGKLQNADADVTSAGAATVPLFLSFCRCSMERGTCMLETV